MLITTCTKNRERIFADEAFAREAVESLYRTKSLHPFELYGFVVMPDHCHIHLYVPPDQTISSIMGSYKSAVVLNTGLQRVWQRRFHIRIPDSLSSVQYYIDMNPVRAGFVDEPHEYPWSSASGMWKLDEFFMN